MSVIEVEIKNLDKLQTAIRRSPQGVARALNDAVRTSLYIIRPIMVEEAPRGKTGNLRKNIKVTVGSSFEGSVGPNLEITPYAWFVHKGTRPHIIRPKSKKALYWEGAPEGHPWKLVHHPGTKANPFVHRTFDRIKEPVQHIFQSQINKFIDSFHF